MFDIDWKRSVFHQPPAARFLAPGSPGLGDDCVIRLRVFNDAPVRAAFLWYRPDNREEMVRMKEVRRDRAFTWYEAGFRLEQPRIHYHFIIATNDHTYYYNVQGLHETQPPSRFDFALSAAMDRPSWLDGATFYQIFPDRFRDGDPSTNVRDGEYSYRGYSTKARSWNQKPLEYEDSGCLDFFGGDLPGIREKLDYLQELGVTALYINPIFTAPSHHKYDCVDYKEVDPHLGGDAALKDLVRACHDRSMRVILDISVNHTGTAHRWFDREGLFGGNGAFHHPGGEHGRCYLRRDEGDGPWGDPFVRWRDVDALVTLDYGSDELRRRIYGDRDSVLRYWLSEPFNIDGWRFDVAYMMARYKDRVHYRQVWQDIRRACKETSPDCYLLSEDWTDASEFLQGDMFDGVMNYYGFARPVRCFLGQTDHYLGRRRFDWRVRPRSARTLWTALSHNLHELPAQMHGLQFNLLDSHDWHRLHNDDGIPFSAYASAVCMLFTFPGVPSIYYGDEVGIDGHLSSVEGCRYPMPWNPKLWKAPFVDLYTGLGRFRRQSRALALGPVVLLLAEGRMLSYARFTDEEIVVTVVSGEDAPSVARLPVILAGAGEESTFTDVLDGERFQCTDGRLAVPVPARSGRVLAWKAD